MKLRKAWHPSRGPYDPLEISRRIEQRRLELGIKVHALVNDPILNGSGLSSPPRWSDKKNGKEDFTEEQISRLFVLLKGWTGFPYVPREIGEVFDALKAPKH